VKTFFKELLVIVLSAMIIFLLVQVFFVGRYIVDGSSMEPNLYDNQRILVNKIAYAFSGPQRGDIIVLTPPYPSEHDLIKRIIGLPGDTVEIKDRVVYINGEILNEPYISDPPTYTLAEQVIPDNEYFVLGDNRNNSSDSHFGWTVNRDSIHGRAWFTIWPLSDWGSVLNFDYALP
jgi:signal peptidase I